MDLHAAGDSLSDEIADVYNDRHPSGQATERAWEIKVLIDDIV